MDDDKLEDKLPYGAFGYGTLEVHGQYRHPEMPLGLGMALAQNVDAMSFFGSLTEAQQRGVINYVTACTTGEEAKERVAIAVNKMKEHNANFSTYQNPIL